MADLRNKDVNWSLNDRQRDGVTYELIKAAVLMDIRDELRQLNRVFSCANFQNMPHEIRKLRIAVERIDRRLAKRRKR